MRPGELSSLRRFTTGRRLYCFKGAQQIAQSMEFQRLLPLLADAIAHDRKTLDLELRWGAQKAADKPGATKGPSRATLIDRQLDLAIGALSDLLSRTGDLEGADSPKAAAAKKVLVTVLPAGASDITLSNWEDAVEKVDQLVRLAKSEVRAEVATLNLGGALERIETLARDFRAALSEQPSERLKYSDVVAAQNEGQDYLTRVVFRVVDEFGDKDPEQSATREELLREILIQNEKVGDYYRRKKPIPDVNPDTGEELSDVELL